MTDEQDNLGRAGERACIRRLAALTGAGPAVATGIGDDCAVVRAGPDTDWLLTTDPVIEGVHFLPDTPGEAVGHKAAGRVLSDIAAMGGEPLWLLVDLVGTPETPMARLEAAYRGASALAARHGAAIVGGDVARGPVLELHVFAVGCVPRGAALLRSGARPGHAVYVTGDLGGTLAGKHLAFEPRIAEARWLREGGWAAALMDLSDGLASDLRRLLEQSGCGAEIRLDRVPVAAAARAADDGRSPLDHALGDGEDFELLFTVPAERCADFESAWRASFALPCTAVGAITPPPQEIAWLGADGRPVREGPRGYEHFVTP